jgi:hypothetical protein
LKLPAHKLRVVIPPEELRLPDEPDEVEKENSKLKAELARHQNRIPRLQFSFLDGSSRIALPSVQAAVQEVEADNPSQFGTTSYEYDRYVSDLETWKKEALFSTGFRIRRENTGNAVATNIKIQMGFPEFVLAVRLRNQPKVPSIMSPFWMHSDVNLPSEEAPTYSDKQDTVSFELGNLVHNRTFESDLIFLRFANADVVQNFSCEYFITCVEMIEPIQGSLHFTVQDWIAFR